MERDDGYAFECKIPAFSLESKSDDKPENVRWTNYFILPNKNRLVNSPNYVKTNYNQISHVFGTKYGVFGYIFRIKNETFGKQITQGSYYYVSI